MSSFNPQTDKTGQPQWGSFWQSRENLLFLSAVLIITFMVYLPSLQNGFVNWDDQINIYENPHITNITGWKSFLENVKGMFTTHVMGNYNPLSILSFAFEKMFYGLDRPELMHLNNIILHLVCVLLVFRIALALGLKLIPAAFCALLFGIHPMRVESVAWITERKDVLFGSFYLLALYYYIKSVRITFRKRYSLLILLSFTLALLSKIQAVILPLSMLLVDYYFDRKLSLKLLYEKWLYFLLSLATGILGIYFLRVDGGIASTGFLSFERIFIGAYSYIVYIIKSVVPYQLVPVYSYPAQITWIYYASIVPVLSILGLLYYLFRKEKKILVFGLLFFTFNIMFLLQILGAGQGFIADRFTYIAYLGLFLVYAYGFQLALERYGKYRAFIYPVVVLVLCVYGSINFAQNRIWQNGETLWTYVLKHNPSTALVWENRASFYMEAGRIEEALHDFTKAIDVKPDNAIAYYSRGNLYQYYTEASPGTLRLALQDYSKAIQFSPETADYFVQRGIVFFKLRMFKNALQDLNTAERLGPANKDIYSYRSLTYINLGRYDKAQPDLERYLRLDPYEPVMWSNLGVLARKKKQYATSINAFNKAIQLAPDTLDYYYKRSQTYYEMGDIQQARNDLNHLKSKGFRGINPDFERKVYQAK